MALPGRRDGPLMRGGGGKPLSRGSRIAVAVAVGVALGCVCAFLYPNSLLFRLRSASALQWSRQVLLFYSLFLSSYLGSCPEDYWKVETEMLVSWWLLCSSRIAFYLGPTRNDVKELKGPSLRACSA